MTLKAKVTLLFLAATEVDCIKNLQKERFPSFNFFLLKVFIIALLNCLSTMKRIINNSAKKSPLLYGIGWGEDERGKK